MRLQVITIIIIIFENVIKIFAQSAPISPCPNIFQYRFDGSEWFGLLTVRNPEFSQPIHLRVTLLLRGQPAMNYLGEIELLTRGQFVRDAPILYKIKFPKNNFPPKLLQIAMNNQAICAGAADHGIFVTQIQLEHTRKFTFITKEVPPSVPPASSFAPSLLAPATDTLGLTASHSPSRPSTGMLEAPMLSSDMAFTTKRLPLFNMGQNSKRLSKDICGTIDDRIRFQVLHKLRQTTDSVDSTYSTQQASNIGSLLLSTLWPRRAAPTAGEDDILSDYENEDENSEPVIISSVDFSAESMQEDEAMTMNELPLITRGAWPWLAAIYVNNLTSLAYQCGGTLVAARIVISAAHCFQLFEQRYTANEVLVFLGRHDLKNWNEEDSLASPVDDIFIHPEYNQHSNSFDADIAVMVLKNEIRFHAFIRPACIWFGSDNQQYIQAEHGIVVGWGLGGLKTTKLASTVPKFISTPIVSNEVCFRVNPKFHSLSSHRTFCAGTQTHKGLNGKPLKFHQQLHRGPCAGDSGAGLMIFKGNRWMLRGIVSGSLPQQSAADDSSASTTARPPQSCDTNQYVVYADVAKFLDWIYAFII